MPGPWLGNKTAGRRRRNVGRNVATREDDEMSRRKRLTFWGVDENDDSLPRSVMEGRKTVTADTIEDYYKPHGEYGDGSYATGDFLAQKEVALTRLPVNPLRD